MRANSLALRLFLSATVWTVLILLVTGFALSGLYRNSVERGFDRRLGVYLKTLIADLASPDIPIEKTSVIHLGSALTVSTELANEPPLPEPPYLLYVGARNFYKNFAGLLRALARSPELLKSFRLVCFGGGGFTPSEKSMIASLGLPSDAVRQLSGNDRLLSKLYSHASVFICPSLYEGFGIPVLEAMSQGCPVVCSDTSSLPEVAGNAAEYFAPEDPDAMLAAIERVINSPARAQQLTALGYERVKLFSWDRCASQTLDAYRRLLGVR